MKERKIDKLKNLYFSIVIIWVLILIILYNINSYTTNVQTIIYYSDFEKEPIGWEQQGDVWEWGEINKWWSC